MSEKKTKKKTKGMDVIFLIIIFALGSALGYGGYKIYDTLHTYKVAESTYDTLIDQYVKEEVTVNENSEEEVTYSIDFDSLLAVNSEIVGWLRQEGTVIDYPVAKGKNNDKYLRHLVTGEYNNAGTLFVDFRNRDLFEDTISVIYGHNMHNGSMFHCLEDYQTQEYYDEHKEFYFYTPEHTYLLEPFAGEQRNAEIPFLQFNFNSSSPFEDYIQDFLDSSVFKSDVEVHDGDKVIMMISCSYDYTAARYVLLCKVTEIA